MIKVMAFLPVFVILFTYIVLYRPKKIDKQKRISSSSRAFSETCNSYLEPFDIEKECLKLQEEREKQEPYIITLWLGFDGLRLNADGSTEWISRRAEPERTRPRHGFSALPKSVFEDLSCNCGTIHPDQTETKDTVENRLEILIQDARSRLEESRYKDSYAANELMALYRMKINLQSINIACQNTTLQNALYAQCQNAALPSYPSYSLCNSPYMTSYAPHWSYCAGGNFGTYKS